MLNCSLAATKLHNVAIYKVQFDFSNEEPLRIGSLSRGLDYENMVAPGIKLGQGQLQVFVNAFNALNVGAVKNDELLDLIVDPETVLNKRIAANTDLEIEKEAFDAVLKVRNGNWR